MGVMVSTLLHECRVFPLLSQLTDITLNPFAHIAVMIFPWCEASSYPSFFQSSPPLNLCLPRRSKRHDSASSFLRSMCHLQQTLSTVSAMTTRPKESCPQKKIKQQMNSCQNDKLLKQQMNSCHNDKLQSAW